MKYKTKCTRADLRRAFTFVKLLRVEPFLFLLGFQVALKAVPEKQIIEDMICRNWYNQSRQYCYDLPASDESGTGTEHYKSTVLSDAAQLGTYSIYLSAVPAILWSLFVGPWFDRYPKGRKIIMLLSVGTAIIETVTRIYLSLNFSSSVYWVILSKLPSTLLGDYYVGATHYMSTTTPPHLLATRYFIFTLINFIATTIASSLAGYLFEREPLFPTGGEIRNYTLVFIICLACQLMAILWIVFFVDEEFARKQELKIEQKIREMNANEDNDDAVKSEQRSDDVERRHPLRMLFEMANVKAMWSTCIKRRPNRARLQLWLLFAGLLLWSATVYGPTQAFDQRVYNWAPDMSGYFRSFTMTVHFVATLTVVPVFIRVLKLADLHLGIIGMVSRSVSELILGTWLYYLANYVTAFTSSLAGIGNVGIKAYMMKIVDRDEMGRIICFISVLDAFAPMIAAPFYTVVFKATVDDFPGVYHHMNVAIIFVSMFIMMWIDLFTKRPVLPTVQ